MSFVKQVKTSNQNSTSKKPFYKRKGWKIFFVIFATFLICLVSFAAYIYATGSKIFDKQFGDGSSSLVRAIKGEKLSGEEDGRVNFVLLGRGGDNHPGGLLTDSLLVGSIDVKNKKLALISVPRDLLVPIKNHGQDKINAAFADGYNDYMSKSCKKKNQNDCRDSAMAAGSEMTRETVSNVLGIPIQYYVMIDFEGFKQIVDKLGGIDIYVDKAIYDPLYPDKNMQGYEPFSIKAGQHHMNGDLALKYSRSRETTSDFDRSRRQQQVISAIKGRSMQAGILANPKKILDLVTIVGNHVRTNFSPNEIKLLADLVKDINQDQIISKVLSSGTGGLLVSDSSTGIYYLKPKAGNFGEIQSMVKNIFSNNNTSTEKTSTKIEVLNASKTVGVANKVASQLKVGGDYQVMSIQNATEKSTRTKIYDYSGGKKKAAVDFLKTKYKAEVISKTPDPNKNVDISLIIGDDFSASS